MLTFTKEATCCFTGHRKIDDRKVPRIVERLHVEIEIMQSCGVRHFIAGGALGFDTLAALSILQLQSKGQNIFLHLMLPCPDQCRRWNERDKAIYNHVMSRADTAEVLCDHYHSGVMQMRNRAMVDAAGYCLCYWDKDNIPTGKPCGGTYYTVNYARKQGTHLINLWDEPPEDLALSFDFTE